MSLLSLDRIDALNSDVLIQQLPIEKLDVSWARNANVELYMLRLDLTDVHVSGNKWFKLACNIQSAKQRGDTQLLSFGGAFSNHIFSFSHACQQAGLKPVVVIRGEELNDSSNPMLQAAKACGAHFIFVSRTDYRRKYEPDRLDFYRSLVGEFTLIPEGGSNEYGVLGCESIAALIASHGEVFDQVYMACGTGATFSGLVRGFHKLNTSDSVLPDLIGLSLFSASSVDPESGWMTKDVARFLEHSSIDCVNYTLVADKRLPKYGKLTSSIIQFISEFLDETGLLLDPVYTCKLLKLIQYHCDDGNFTSSGRSLDEPTKILAVHTGGLHGWFGYSEEIMPAQLSGTIKQRLLS
jgi:1-aminocyclopropane-1-carboxylate deaminase